MKSKTLNGIIIRRKNIGEADKLITIFTLEEGKISVKARGIRKPKSKLCYQVELFNSGRFHLIEGKKFYTLAGCETKSYVEIASKDLRIYGFFSYCSELLLKLLPDNTPYEDVFKFVLKIWNKAGKVDIRKLNALYDYFNVQVLKFTGFLPNVLTCIKCNQLLNESDSYQGDLNGIYCENCGSVKKNLSKNDVKYIKILYSDNLEQILKLSNLETIRNNFDKICNYYLKDLLGQPIKSREII